MRNVICIKWGPKYGTDYANILYSMVRRHCRTMDRFVCITDDPSDLHPDIETVAIPEIDVLGSKSPWKKISLLAPEVGDLKGTALFFDLDMVILDNIDCFFEYSGDFCIIENWTTLGRGVGNSSLFRFEIGAHAHVYHTFRADPAGVMARFPNSQTFMSKMVAEATPLTWWPDEWVRSFKRHCVPWGPLMWLQTPRQPANAKVIAFHGDPKPSDAIAGVWPGRWTKHVRPTPWIKEHWR